MRLVVGTISRAGTPKTSSETRSRNTSDFGGSLYAFIEGALAWIDNVLALKWLPVSVEIKVELPNSELDSRVYSFWKHRPLPIEAIEPLYGRPLLTIFNAKSLPVVDD